MHAYIGDAFFKKILNIDSNTISFSVKIICGGAASGVSLLTRVFPILDNYYSPLDRVDSNQMNLYLTNMTFKEKVLCKAKVLPLPLFRCGYAYVLGSVIYRLLDTKEISPLGCLGISGSIAVALGSLLFFPAYFAGHKHELNMKIIGSATAPVVSSEKIYYYQCISADNKFLKALSTFINVASQFTWGVVGIAFMNSILKGIMTSNEIIVAATSVSAEVAYSGYFYMGPKIHQGLVASLNTFGQFCKRSQSIDDEHAYPLLAENNLR